jgi:hypothetical protein
MPTVKQIEANRRNALKSTGPKTPEGKARSSQNAVKHGLYARRLLVTSPRLTETEAGFKSVNKSILSQLNPRTPTEHELTTHLARAAWQLLRAENVTTPKLPDTVPNPIPDEILRAVRSVYNRTVFIRRLKKRLQNIFSLFTAVKRTQFAPVPESTIADHTPLRRVL